MVQARKKMKVLDLNEVRFMVDGVLFVWRMENEEWRI
jgi:hypothetical protein